MNLLQRRNKLSAETLFVHRCRDGTQIPCRHLRKKRIKNLYLRIQRDGSVDVSTPWRYGVKDAALFVSEKEAWIQERLSHAKSHGRSNPATFRPGCEAWYLGKKYPVAYEKSPQSRVAFKNGLFLFRGPAHENFEGAMERFYLRSAKEILPGCIERWSETMGLSPSQVKFRRFKSRWGSCSRNDVITLNSALMRYEQPLIDYVIIHELAHIRYKHHRKEFWELVADYAPNYRELRRRLV